MPTFTGTIGDGGETLLYGAWGLIDDATGEVIYEALVGAGDFSVDLSLTATTPGSSYTLIIGALNASGFTLDYKTVVITKDAGVECDPDDFVCIVEELWGDAETTLLDEMIDEWWDAIIALVDAGDLDDAKDAVKDFDKAAKDLVKDADKVSKDLEKDAKAVSKALKDDVKDIRKYEKKVLDQDRKATKKLMDAYISLAECGATDYVCLAEATAEFADLDIDDVLDSAEIEFDEVLDDGKDDVKDLFDGDVTQETIDEAYDIKDEAEADALELQSDADTAAQALLAQAVSDLESLRDQASGGDVADIQDVIDDLIDDMTDDIDKFNDDALNKDIPDKVEKIQKEIDKEE